MLYWPPVTEAQQPLAILSRPPLTDENSPLALFKIPPLTEDRRKELTKQVKAISEETRVAIRNIRKDILEDIEKANLPEDEEKGKDKEVQDLVNEYNKKIDEMLKEKDEELMSV